MLLCFVLSSFYSCQPRPTLLRIEQPETAQPKPKTVGINSARLDLLLLKFAKRGSKLAFAKFVQDWAVQARQIQSSSGIPAQITLAVALLETGGGQSEIARQSNNLFNIKALKTDCSYRCGRGSNWAKYESKEQSFAHFARLVSGYNLGEITPHRFAQSPYLAGASKIKRAKYAQKIQDIIEQYDLIRIFTEG